MTQSPYKTYTVNDWDRKAYKENWETKDTCIESYYEPIHHLKSTAAEGKVNDVIAITDSTRAAESKDGPKNNPTVAALVERLLKEARTACNLLQQQGQWQQENTTGRIRRDKFKGGRANTSGLFDTCDKNSDIKDNRKSFSRTSRRLFSKPIKEQKKMEVTKEICLLMSDLTVSCRI